MKAQPIKAPCNRTYFPAFRSSGTRKISDIKLVVIHSTEGGTADSIARYFYTPGAGGSTHLVVDDYECERCLANSTVPWGATGANRNGFHIEMCGFARWTLTNWLQHRNTIKRCAYKTAFHCDKFGIPLVWLSAADLKAGKSGITSHAEVSKAFPGSGHWDPGPGFPRRYFMSLVRKYAKELL